MLDRKSLAWYFRREMAMLDRKMTPEVAQKWMEWQDANEPSLRDHVVRLWRTLRKGRTNA